MKNIVLFGFMGSGKSMISKRLSGILKMRRVDMDYTIEQREKMSVTEIFAQKGEPYFRELERKLASDLSNSTDLIISTGGGVVLNDENIANLGKNSLCFCLNAKPEVIYERIKHHTNRPLLLTDDPLGKIKDLMEKRKPFYEKVPFQIITENKTPEEICNEIIEIYKNNQNKSNRN